ncbi:AAA domain-containing protein, putative AbiEii toxin, Type IV TA system [Duganella sp. CF402]|uniref:AAA family ATPase n=1 Tax=unclassified Duganella TaxID=2636909 RepID=UPI0008ABE2D9|nr:MULTISPECIES: AAA family ATPase [unclassified Duganella]RZT09785.1 putative AbiEii toxin of type IV toxin-antitoxin system [Duganella sp. BK701]SEL42930.1 AAA domain-containing protein, putative AbiEii toxin, Type IV TA system [Duganella sp. CF402]
MIEHVTFGSTQLNFGTSQVHYFSRIFNVESFNLLIGSNGSGKTSGLLKAASLVAGTWSEGESGSVRTTRNSRVASTSGPDASYGVIYYTALPYRKKFKQTAQLVDASPKWSEKREIQSIERFREIAENLNSPTRLQATIGYDYEEVAELFIPFLFALPIELNDKSLRDDLALLRENYDGPFRSEPIRQLGEIPALDKFYDRFFRTLSDALDKKSLFGQQIALATLLKLVDEEYFVDDLLYGILDDLHMIRDEHSEHREMGEYARMTKATLHYLVHQNADMEGSIEQSGTRLRFEITSHRTYQDIVGSDLPIELRWENLSSGMLSLVDQFTHIDSAAQQLWDRRIFNLVILIDEGDAFLHLEWQRRYIALLTDFLASLREKFPFHCMQIMLASHSPILAGDVPSCLVQNLDIMKISAKTFGAELDDIILRSFKSSSIGEHAAKHIRRLHALAKEGVLSPFDRALIGEIGDQSIRKAILAADASKS